MRVLLLSQMYPSNRNPSLGVYIRNQVEEMRTTHGLEPRLVVSYVRPTNPLGRIFKYFALHLKAWGVAFTKFDVAHLHYPSPIHLLAASPALLIRSKRLVITTHRGDIYALPDSGPSRWVTRKFLQRADAIVAVSGDLKKKMTDELGISAEKISIVDVGCDLRRFTPCLPSSKGPMKKALGLPEDELVLLFVGDVIRRKGLDLLFAALADLETLEGVSLHIVGVGPEQEELETTPSYLEIRDHVRWVGELPNTDLPRRYAAADAFILPSRSEGTPTVLLEAMSSGAPVISSSVGGVPDLITHDHNGLLFESEDIDRLRDCLQRLVQDGNLRERLAAQALEDIKEHSLEKQIARVVRLFRPAADAR